VAAGRLGRLDGYPPGLSIETRSWSRRTEATIGVQGMRQEMMAFEEGHMMSENQEAAAFASNEAVDRLAKRLYSDLIRLDPVEGDPEWSALPDIDRQLYRQLIEGLGGSPDWALAALPTKGNHRSGGSQGIEAPHAVDPAFALGSPGRCSRVRQLNYRL